MKDCWIPSSKFGLLALALVLVSSICREASAQCQSSLTLTNNSKYRVQFFVNGFPFRIVNPGESVPNAGALFSGANTVTVKGVLNRKGQVDTKVEGPKPSKVAIDCSRNLVHTLTFANNNFHRAKKPKTPKKVGNKDGATLNLDGQWVQADLGCVLDIDDLGSLVSARLSCSSLVINLNGTRLGGILLLFGTGLSATSGTVSAALATSIFGGVEDDETGQSFDVLKGTFYLDQLKAPTAFLRPSS